MNKKWDYNKIMSDHGLFNKTVYTPLSEAIKILEERQKDPELVKKIEKLLNNDIPEPLKKLGKNAVQFRQIATPNHDVRWFVEIAKDHGLPVVFFEYFNDKFTSNNSFKHSLGQLRIHDHLDKNGKHMEEKITIIDFNKYNGKPIREVLTLWDESLIDFHRRLFDVCEIPKDHTFFDASNWFKENGEKAVDYYINFIALFICHGILFENFLTDDDSEGDFTKNILLPSFEKVVNITGLKPLIVPIPPMANENDVHWISYNIKVKPFLKLLKLK